MLQMLLILYRCCLAGGDLPVHEQGLASYYNDSFQGKKTASGELYDRMQYTAAHRTIPFGARVQVINLKNNKSVVVRINDRGPWVKNRIIDLSYIAARDLDMIKDGLVKVKIKILK